MVRRLAAGLSIVAMLMLAGGPPVSSFVAQGATYRAAPNPSWATWNAATKTATLTVVADYNDVAAGFNFDGYNQGKLTFTVPVGAHVVVNFTNKAPLPHSAVITPYADRAMAGNFPDAFPGSALANAGSGVANLTKAQSFTFVATKAGTYAIVCGVPGHAVAGMWDVLTVANVATPSVSLTGAAPASGAGTTASMTSSWVKWNAATKTATLTVVADYNDVAAGFNFDGYNQGKLTFTVPVGAHVVVNFTNKAPLPHSAVITPYVDRAMAGNFPDAFPGSALANAGSGVANLTKAQSFTFVATKAGTYAIVCGVPGHAVAGMWDVLTVANVATPSASLTSASAAPSMASSPAMTNCVAGKMGAVGGTVVDAATGKPVAHTYIVIGWTTLKRVAETDAQGNYCAQNLPNAYVDAFGFAQGYVYYHGHPITIRAGKTVDYSIKMPQGTFPDAQLPHLTGATITPTSVKPGDTATFSVHIKPGTGGPMSPEVFAVNGPLGQSVLLLHAGGDMYRGTWQAPMGAKAGSYSFSFFGAMENCLENNPYPDVMLTIAGS